MAFTGKNARPINSPSQKIIKGRFPMDAVAISIIILKQ